MAIDYNANLIAELYKTADAERATLISDEMAGIGDGMFPRQIYEAYKKFKDSTYSHYFVSDLTKFKSKDASDILKEIALTTDEESDISMMIEYLTDIEYFETAVLNKILNFFFETLGLNKDPQYDIGRYLAYIEKSGVDLSIFIDIFKGFFEDEEKSISSRKIILRKFFKINPELNFQYYYDNYESIVNKKSEIILAEVVAGWKGTTVSKLKEKILEIGSNRAKEIIEKSMITKKEQDSDKDRKEQDDIKLTYSSSDIVYSIADLRSRVNKLAIANPKFGYPIFKPSEEIYKQTMPPKNKESLVGYCIELRSTIQGISSDITNIIYDEEEAGLLIPGIVEINASLNKFNMLLLKANVVVDTDLFGLRTLNSLMSKIAHPEGQEDTIKLLTKLGLVDLYTNNEWTKLHREILVLYKNALEKLAGSLVDQTI